MFDIRKHEIRQCSISEFNGIAESLNQRVFKFESAQGKNVGPRVYLWFNISKAYLVYNEFGDNYIVTRCLETDLNDLYEGFNDPKIVEDLNEEFVVPLSD